MLQCALLCLCAAAFFATASPGLAAPADPKVATPPEFEEPAGELRLPDAAALALLHNPRLASVAWEIRVREAGALQAGRRPNPEVSLEVENFAGSGDASGFGGSETTISLSQLLERGGKRDRLRDAARLDRDLAGWDYESRRLDVLAEVTRTFIDLLAAQEHRTIAADLVSLAEQSLETMTRRVAAGAVSPVEETRARVALSQSRLDLRAAEGRLADARVRLASLWGSVAPRFERAVGVLDPVSPPPSLEELLERMDGNPELARWDTETARRRAEVAVQRALGAVDVSVAAGVRHRAETSDRAFVLGLSVPLPLSDRNQGARRAAEYQVEQTLEEARAVRLDVERAITLAHQAAVAGHEEILALDGEILPDAEAAFETALEAHRKGLFRLTDVLDTRRTLFELRARRVESLREYHRTRAEMERLIGEPLPSGRR